MKRSFLLLLASLFLLSGCSPNVNNPYEIAKGSSTLSYYDTEDNINLNDFTISRKAGDMIANRYKSDNCIFVKDGIIRCIYIVDEDIITYKGISVGDSVDKIKKEFNNISQITNVYSVLFNNNTEEDPANKNKEDTWIWVTYGTDGSQITSIQIYDELYGRTLH